MKITRNMIETIVGRVNAVHGLPDGLYLRKFSGELVRQEDTGSLIPNAGVVYLTGVNGGWRLEKMCAGGGSSDFLHATYESKKVVYLAASAYLKGLLEGKQG
jgi:hypothetical protein